MKARMIVVITTVGIFLACAAPNQQGPSPEHGMSSALQGLAHLVLSPLQIAAGLLEGIASVPYFLTTSIHEVNRGMVEAQAQVALDDTYEAAYGTKLTDVPESGDTGEVFRRMKHATESFQKVLKTYGIHDAERYILTSIDTANKEGFTLFAVVYRPADSIQVFDKYNPSSARNFEKQDRLFYEPFQKDANGRTLDEIVDWAAMPREDIKTQKAQAILITLAANSVIEGKKSPDYWENERRWIAGQFREITNARLAAVRNRMGL
ncbi:MAG: hypothetical protein JSV83_00110 [Desulfobacterales bacterium]|nr:MAG: hypothetical protein JSV83_00110 [Desulfobacterales bacterium]